MKTAKRVLAVMIAVIMIVGTCAVAASAAYTTTTEDGVTKITLNSNTTKTLTIDSDTVIDLNGYRLRGEDGKAAIKISAGNVTVTNGQVMAFFGKMSTLDMIQTVHDHCPPAISMTGGDLTLDGVRVIGGTIRVPTTPIDDPILVPAGSGIMTYNGATVTLKRTSIYGDYGVNNAVRDNPAGGLVTIEDALIASYAKAIKGGKDTYVVADGSEEIIAADRITGVLNSGITLEPGEQELVDNFFDERVIIVTKTADELTSMLDEDLPLVTKIDGISIAEIEAPILDYTWENTKGTDCSYRLVPEAITKLSDGTSAELDSAQADKIVETSKIRYRVQFQIGDEAMPYIESLLAEGLDNPLDGVLGWAGEELNSAYASFTAKNNNGYVDTYDELIAELGKLMITIDSLGNKTIKEALGLTDEEAAAASQQNQTYVKEMAIYTELQQKLYRLAGATGFNAKYPDGSYTFTENQWISIFGTDEPMPEYVGTLDRVQALKDQLEQKLGPRMFLNTAAFGDVAVWAIETAYPQLMTTLDEAIDRLTDLQDFIAEGDMADLVAFAGIQSQVNLLNEGVDNATMIRNMITDILGNGDAAAAVDYATAHKSEIKGYVNKAVEVIENWRTYVTPEKFLVNDEETGEIRYATTYSTLGSIEIEEVEVEGNLHLTVSSGKGTISYDTTLPNGDGTVTNEVTGGKTVPFENTFTLTATPKENYEFLFWVNKEAGGFGRILTTEPTFTMNTNLDRDIEAVFNYIDAPMAYFTNPTGALCGSVNVYDGFAATEEVDRPYIAGYGFMGWPNETSDGIDLTNADLTAYADGNSAFATLSSYYGPEGAALLVRPTSTSYIVTPVYSKNGGYAATFIDGDETWVGEGNYSDIAEYTAVNGDYWVLEGTDTVVCVNKYFPYQMIDNPTFTAVSGTCPVDTVTKTTVREENGYAVFYIERSTNKTIKQTGMVYSTKDSTPSFAEGCALTTAKNTDQTGLFAPSVKISALGGKTFYGVAYIEFTDGTYYESPEVFQFPG